MSAVQRRAAIRVACCYRTVSMDAALVLAGLPPIDLLARERQQSYDQSRGGTNLADPNALSLLQVWQGRWRSSNKGRWTFRLIPDLGPWLGRGWGELDFWLTQLLTGHGGFRAYLYRFRRAESPLCPECEVDEDAEHVIVDCPRFQGERGELRAALHWPGQLTPEYLGRALLSGPTRWEAVASFAAQVMRRLSSLERRRNATALPRAT